MRDASSVIDWRLRLADGLSDAIKDAARFGSAEPWWTRRLASDAMRTANRAADRLRLVRLCSAPEGLRRGVERRRSSARCCVRCTLALGTPLVGPIGPVVEGCSSPGS